MWEFSIGLYMIHVFPDSLLLPAVYGVVESASTALFGPVVGQLVDSLTYVKVYSGLYPFVRSPLLENSETHSNVRNITMKQFSEINFLNTKVLLSYTGI